jgi:plastocyanin
LAVQNKLIKGRSFEIKNIKLKFMNKILWIIVAILLLVFVGYFLMRGYRAPTPTPTVPTPTAPAPTAPKEEVTPTLETPVKEITVVGTEFSFNPSSITLSAGERVKIIFKNEGKAPHNLVIQGLGIGTRTIGGGQTDTIEFTAPSSGTYTFYCSVPGHRAAGMEGRLEVN